jgi:hypothetical protein
MEDEITYRVLAYEDACGLWLKIPGLNLQCCACDLDSGLEVLDEGLEQRRRAARKEGRDLREALDRNVEWVEKEEFGLTEQEIRERLYLEELAEESAGEDEEPSAPVVVVNISCEFLTNIWMAEIPGVIRGVIRAETARKLMHRIKITVDRRFGYSKRAERQGKERPYALWLYQLIYPMFLAAEGEEAGSNQEWCLSFR